MIPWRYYDNAVHPMPLFNIEICESCEGECLGAGTTTTQTEERHLRLHGLQPYPAPSSHMWWSATLQGFLCETCWYQLED